MARDYDSQLLESVAVRRRRLRDALLFGSQRVRRTLDENLGKTFGGIALAAVVCAGCVGWSFISEKMGDRSNTAVPQSHSQQSGYSGTASSTASSTAGTTATW